MSTKNQELLGMLNGWMEACRKGRFSFERKWYENMAFYFGKQYVQWTNTTVSATGITRLYEPPVPPWRVRMVINKIKPIIRREVSKLVKEKPQPFVIPATTDDDDLAAARAGEAIFDHVWRTLNGDKVTRQAIFWMCICGTSYIKDWYDPDMTDDNDIAGSICIEAVNPFQLYVPDPQEITLDNQPYIIHVLSKSAEWVKKAYKVDIAPDTDKGGGILEQRFLAAMGLLELPKAYVTVREAWIKPSPKFKKGAVITWAGGQILNVHEEWPWGYKDYPFTKLDHVMSGQFYADSVIRDLIPVQKELNRTRSQIIESKNRMSKPQLAAPRGSIDPTKITTEPGLIVFYTPGFQPPTPIPLVPIPGYVIQEVERCQQDMDDISGQHDVSKGKAPADVSAATAISFIQEQDDTMLSTTIVGIEEGIGRIGRHILCHVSAFWEAERSVRTLGENNTYEVYMFNKASINGNTDLNIQAGSAMPRSEAAKKAFITELMDKKYITPEQGLRYLNMAETNRMYEELQVSARQAQRENLRMMNGEEVDCNTFDEDQIHLNEHNMFRRRQAFENASDDIKTVFESHCQTHTQRLGQAQGTPIHPGESLPPAPSGGSSPDGGPPDAGAGPVPGLPPGGPPPTSPPLGPGTPPIGQ